MLMPLPPNPRKSLKAHQLRARQQQQPSHIDRLLQSLVKSLNVVPDDADPVHDRGELPSAGLRHVIAAATRARRSWRCWMDMGLRVWLFVGALSLPRSREHGAPVLQVDYHRESGLVETAYWVIDRHANWHRCADATVRADARTSTARQRAR
jgi:hypothetical protein